MENYYLILKVKLKWTLFIATQSVVSRLIISMLKGCFECLKL